MEALRSRWVRFPSYVLGGFGGAALLARVFHPHYLPLCDRINPPRGLECSAVSVQAMIGFFIIGLGLITLVIVPIIASIVHLLRNGPDWEMARGTETAQTNLPILAGIIYLTAGTIVALAAY
jgi:hypothetical protein